MDPDDLAGELALALDLADRADALTLPHFRAADLSVDRKADATEVTAADRDAEAAIRRRLTEARPHHAVLGEEEGLRGAVGSAWQWVIDPLDGTTNFVRGVPIWATLIALEHEGRPVVGVASAPALGRRWWAGRGLGAFAAGLGPFVTDGGGDAQPIRVSAVSELADAHLAHAGVGTFYEYGRGDALVALTRRVGRSRGLGDFWMHVLVAEGGFDIACEPVVNHWDLAAVQVIVEEAGGRFTDVGGAARPDGGSALSSNGHLHDVVLATLGSPETVLPGG